MTKREKAARGSKDTPTICYPFGHLVNSELPPSELKDERLLKEARVLIGSGTISIAGTLGFVYHYIMANLAIRKRLAETPKDGCYTGPSRA